MSFSERCTKIKNSVVSSVRNHKRRAVTLAFTALFVFCLITGYWALSLPYVIYRGDIYDPYHNLVFSGIDIFNSEFGGKIDNGFVGRMNMGGRVNTATAIALPGYKFIGWGDGIASAQRTDRPAAGKTSTYVANFEMVLENVPTLLVTSPNYYGFSMQPSDCSFRIYDSEKVFQSELGGALRYYDTSHMFKQNNYRLTFDTPYDLMEIGSASTEYCLISEFYDYGKFRTRLALDLYARLTGESVSMQFVDMFLDLRYMGLFLCVEVPESAMGIKCTYEASTESPDFIVRAGGKSYPYTLADSSQAETMQSSLEELYEAVLSGERERIEALLDVDGAAAAYLLCELFGTARSAEYNHITLGADGKFRIWATDFDFSSGLYQPAGANNTDSFHLLSWLSNYDWFQELVLRQWDSLSGSFDFEAKLAEIMLIDSEAVDRSVTRWDLYTKAQADMVDVSDIANREEWGEFLLAWLNQRVAFLDDYYAAWR